MHIILQDAEDKYAPPSEPMLSISQLGDQTYLTIIKHEEDNTTTKTTTIAEVCVATHDLMNALTTLVGNDIGHKMANMVENGYCGLVVDIKGKNNA